jgi:hydroxymethylbilane synthase
MQVKIGTRGSKLALWQANWVRDVLVSAGWDTNLVTIRSEGDLVQGVPLHEIGLPGAFTRSLDQAVAAGQVDLAVHSAKDMPSALADGLEVVAFLKREDPRDVLLAASAEVNLENFSRSWILGTSSLRRTAFLRHYFDHIEVKDVRGNVDTRIAKMEAGEYDGLVLAYAGVKRMGLERYIVQKLNLSSFTPAVGQGAVAVVCRKDFEYIMQLKAVLNHPDTEHALRCERAFLRTIDGGCKTPAFGYASVFGDRLTFTGGIAETDGSVIHRHTEEGRIEDAVSIGNRLAHHILAMMSRINP